jgi:HAE1 family hydrophobic/amphiphilic exporter-1
MRVQPSMLMYVNVYSTDEDADEKFLFNFANVNILPEVMRIKGIGQAASSAVGSTPCASGSTRPDARLQRLAEDVHGGDRAEQSVIGSPGRVGQATGKTAQSLEYVLVYEGRYNKPEQYEDIIIRATPDGHILHLKDVAEVELGSEFFDIYSNLDGHPSAAIVLKQTLGSNARRSSPNVKAKLEEIKDHLPAGHGLRDQLRRLAVPRRLDRAGRPHARSRRSCWWRWSSSCSSATGARR